MDDGARLWLVKTARKNYWRVCRWYELDDLVQEGFAAYYKVLLKYPKAKDVQHRMALFKQVYLNRLHDLANERTRAVAEVCEADLVRASGATAESILSTIADAPTLLEALPALATAPQYVRDALALFGSGDGVRRLRAAYRKVRVGRHLVRETLNERLCRLTGYDPTTTDIVGGIKACLEDPR